MNEYEKTLLTILFYFCIALFFFIPAACIICCKKRIYLYGKKKKPVILYYDNRTKIKYGFHTPAIYRKQSFDEIWYMSRQPDYKSLLQDNEKRKDYLSMSV